jgi:hypothetical protein
VEILRGGFEEFGGAGRGGVDDFLEFIINCGSDGICASMRGPVSVESVNSRGSKGISMSMA